MNAINPKLLAAYKFHRKHGRTAAHVALARTRDDVAAGKIRYPGPIGPAVYWQTGRPGLAYIKDPDAAGLRFIGRVAPDCGGRNGYWDDREIGGWYTDPDGLVDRDGEGLCWGVVYQLPGRDGYARYVAGYQMGGHDDGPTIDFGNIIAEYVGDHTYMYCRPRDTDGAREAARIADAMARRAAERAREYQTAWAAGAMWADRADTVARARETIRELLAERRQARAAGIANYSAICAAIRDRVAGLLDDIRDAREEMRELAAGEFDRDNCWRGFWTGDPDLAAAFNDAAGRAVIGESRQ